jgi:transcriptional regulator with XRE-family HTH domain
MPKHDPILRTLGQTVAKYRQAKGLSQEALAEKAGLHRTYISGIERGIRNPSVKNIKLIAGALAVLFRRIVSADWSNFRQQ